MHDFKYIEGAKLRGSYYGDNKSIYWENIELGNGAITDFIWTKTGMFCRYVEFRAI